MVTQELGLFIFKDLNVYRRPRSITMNKFSIIMLYGGVRETSAV